MKIIGSYFRKLRNIVNWILNILSCITVFLGSSNDNNNNNSAKGLTGIVPTSIHRLKTPRMVWPRYKIHWRDSLLLERRRSRYRLGLIVPRYPLIPLRSWKPVPHWYRILARSPRSYRAKASCEIDRPFLSTMNLPRPRNYHPVSPFRSSLSFRVFATLPNTFPVGQLAEATVRKGSVPVSSGVRYEHRSNRSAISESPAEPLDSKAVIVYLRRDTH